VVNGDEPEKRSTGSRSTTCGALPERRIKLERKDGDLSMRVMTS